MRLLVRIIATLVPRTLRPRWREEWLGELESVARAHGRRTALRMAIGVLADAVATRRVAANQAASVSRRPAIFHALDHDIRYAGRGLSAAPGFVCGVAISLAVGIAGTTAAFSFINAVVFRPFPGVRDQHELVRLTLGRHPNPKFSTVAVGYDDFLTIRAGLSTVQDLSAVREATFVVAADRQLASVRGGLVTGNYFRVLGSTPAAGRFFHDHEDRTPNAHPVVVISDRLWASLYDRSPSALGRSILVNGSPLEIVGVAPAHFIGVRRTSDPFQIWIPMAMGELTLRTPSGRPAAIHAAGPLWLDIIGRRRTDVRHNQIQAEAGALRARLVATRDDPRATVSVGRVWLNDPAGIADELVGFMAVPMLVLAIACVNAANLLFARASRRSREWTVRLALGASRWRVVRQVLVDALLLSAVAGVFGVLLSRWVLSYASQQVPVPMPVDVRVTLFTVAIVIVTALTFSVAPALHVVARAAERLGPVSRGSGRGPRSRVRFSLVALQAALSLGLLATGAQFVRSVQATNANEHVRDPERLVLASFDVDPLRLEPQASIEFYRRLVQQAAALPGVAAAGLASNGLMTGQLGRDGFVRVSLADTGSDSTRAVAFHVTGDLLGAVAAPLRQGRWLAEADATATHSVVINRAFADQLLNGQAVGRTFRLVPPAAAPSDGVETRMVVIDRGLPTFRGGATHAAPAIEVTVVGVVDGIMKRTELEPPIVYYPAPLVHQPARTLYLRLDDTKAFTVASLQDAVRAIDARVPASQISTLADIRQRKDRELKVVTRAVGILGVVSLLLAAGGLYGVVAYIVSLRRQEVGIRIALGADRSAIVGMIVRQALLPTIVGAAVGAAGAAATGAIIRSRMYGAAPVDPWAFGGATVLMLLVMTIASWLPAHQASRVDPVSVLREE